MQIELFIMSYENYASNDNYYVLKYFKIIFNLTYLNDILVLLLNKMNILYFSEETSSFKSAKKDKFIWSKYFTGARGV